MDFYINQTQSTNGPSIFGSRLKNQLESDGLISSEESVNRINIILGESQKNKNNILRLDGLYLDSGNKLGDTDYLNNEILISYNSSNKVVFQSYFSKKCYEEFMGKHKDSYVIRNGVPDIYFNNKSLPKAKKPKGFDKVVIASAEWRRHKRIEEAIECFKSPKLKNVALVILGGYKNVNLNNVFCLPKISPEILPRYYQMADAMIHLSWLDWCPNSVVEGLGCGLPVLCSSNGGTKELVQESGIIIEIEEPYKIGEKVDLYNPPNVDINYITKKILDLIDMPKVNRSDLHIKNSAKLYKDLFV